MTGLSPAQIYVPIRDALLSSQGNASDVMRRWMSAITMAVQFQPFVPLTQFGSAGNGGDDTAVFQAALNQLVQQGGGVLWIPGGLFQVGLVTIPSGAIPIMILGQGEATVLQRNQAIPAGHGMLDIYGSNVMLSSFAIEGTVSTAIPLLYNRDFIGTGGNDPMAQSLTQNSSIWVHGPLSKFMMQSVSVRHTGGYSVLVDAGSGGISDVVIQNCHFGDNRPHTFGLAAGSAVYGSWTGCVYFNSDGRSTNPGCVCKRVQATQNAFLRNTGNCLWMHSYGIDELCESFQFFQNTFLDSGLDGILMGCIIGGAVSGNVFRRNGYVCQDDTSPGVPRWLPNLNATGLDSAGLVLNVPYCNNTFTSMNGGCLDLDSHGSGCISGNVCTTPSAGEPAYEEDQIATSGISGTGATSYGVNLNNSSNTPSGAANVSIVGNSFINLSAGAARLFSARRCLFEGNIIVSPENSVYAPVGLGPVGPGPNQRCFDNRVTNNKIDYNPSASAPAIFEDDTYGTFSVSEKNYVFGNCPITPSGTKAIEFQKSPNSSSPVYLQTPWFT